MKKEELLEKYRQEQQDEGKDDSNRKGDEHGFIALCLLSILLVVYQTIKNQPFGAVTALLFIFLSVGSFSRYRRNPDRATLLFGIITGLVTLGSLFLYVMQTL